MSSQLYIIFISCRLHPMPSPIPSHFRPLELPISPHLISSSPHLILYNDDVSAHHVSSCLHYRKSPPYHLHLHIIPIARHLHLNIISVPPPSIYHPHFISISPHLILYMSCSSRLVSFRLVAYHLHLISISISSPSHTISISVSSPFHPHAYTIPMPHAPHLINFSSHLVSSRLVSSRLIKFRLTLQPDHTNTPATNPDSPQAWERGSAKKISSLPPQLKAQNKRNRSQMGLGNTKKVV